MGKLKFVFLGLITMGAIGYSCKKEPVDSKIFVEKYLVGRWYVNTYVELELTNNDTTHKDTLYQIVAGDTARRWVRYTAAQKFVRNTDTVSFAIDEKGENITFAASPDSTWFIPYVRPNYFKTVFTRKETSGTDVKRYILEQEFRKQ